jgi:hypothetical protein
MIDTYYRARLERIGYTLTRGAPAERLGVSPEAYEDFVDFLDAGGVEQWSVAEANRARTWAAALGADTFRQAAQLLCDLTGHPVATIVELLGDTGNGRRVPFADLAVVVRAVLAGDAPAVASAQAGVSRRIGAEVSRELGIDQATADRELDLAIGWVRAGHSAYRCRQLSGWSNTKVRSLLARARSVLVETGELVAA